MANFTGLLTNANKIILKTRDEALGVPSIEANSDAVVAAKYAREKFMLNNLEITSENIKEEISFLVDEVKKLHNLIHLESTKNKFENIVQAINNGIGLFRMSSSNSANNLS